jgi:hypothetical protein
LFYSLTVFFVSKTLRFQGHRRKISQAAVTEPDLQIVTGGAEIRAKKSIDMREATRVAAQGMITDPAAILHLDAMTTRIGMRIMAVIDLIMNHLTEGGRGHLQHLVDTMGIMTRIVDAALALMAEINNSNSSSSSSSSSQKAIG